MIEHNEIDLGAGPPSSANGGLSAGDRALKIVRDLCVTWERAIKTICLYPASNPLPGEFRTKYFETISAATEELGGLVLATFDRGLEYDGQTVFETPETSENFAYLFFRDGIREIAFEPGLTRDETDAFLNIVAEAFGAGGTPVDIANRLWEASLAHIRHHTVDRVVEGAYVDVADDRELQERHARFIGAGPIPVATETGPLPETGAEDDQFSSPYTGVQRERHKYVVHIFGDVTCLTTAEKAEIVTMCRPESAAEAEDMGLEILFEILHSMDGIHNLDETVGVIEKQLEQSVAADNWIRAKALLTRWHQAIATAPPQLSKRLSTGLAHLGDRRHFEKLATHLNTNPQMNLEPIRELLPLFGTGAITPITAMLGTLEHRPARMMVCDFLASHGRDTVDLIGNFIYDKRWFVARNVAMILGDMGHERGLSFLRKSAGHTDARVRLETLRALKRFQAPEAERILRMFLKDPEVDLRRRALRALGQLQSSSAAQELKEQIDPAFLPEMDTQEMRELLTSYARLGGAEAASLLIRLARRAPLLGRGRWQPVRLAVVWALGASADRRAHAELEALSRDRNQELAGAARAALARHLPSEDDPTESKFEMEESEP